MSISIDNWNNYIQQSKDIMNSPNITKEQLANILSQFIYDIINNNFENINELEVNIYQVIQKLTSLNSELSVNYLLDLTDETFEKSINNRIILMDILGEFYDINWINEINEIKGFLNDEINNKYSFLMNNVLLSEEFDDLYKKIINNYDVRILKSYDDEFIKKFRKFLIDKPDKFILNKLIDNLNKTYNFEYISGVRMLYKLQKNDMTIYLFGEMHGKRDACLNLNLNNGVYVEEFIEKIIEYSPVFIDFYLESPVYHKNYKTIEGRKTIEVLKVIEVQKKTHNLFVLQEKLFNNKNVCSKKEHIECKSRLHFIDIRQYDDNNNSVDNLIDDFINSIPLWFFNEKLDCLIKILQNDFKKSLTNSIIKENISSYSELYDYFFDENIHIKYPNSIFMKEINKSLYDKKLLIGKFKNIFIDNLKLSSISFVDFKSCLTVLNDINIDILLNYKYNDDGRVEEANYFNDLLKIINIPIVIIFFLVNIIMDIYTIARIYKKFSNKDKLDRNTLKPIIPKNIIIYAGSAHIDNYVYFFKNYDGFEIIEEVHDISNCLNIKSIKQPFFS